MRRPLATPPRTSAPQPPRPARSALALRATALVFAGALAAGPAAMAKVGPPLGDATDAAGPATPSAATWRSELEPALAAAAKSHRLLLVDLYADWCGWCKRLDREVFSSAPFAALAADYVLLRVDVEDGAEGAWLQERLHVTGLPALAILDPQLVRVGIVQGYFPTPVFLMKLNRAVDSYQEMLADAERRAKSDDPAELTRLAAELRNRDDGARAAAIYRRLAARQGLAAAERAWLDVGLVEALRLERSYAAAETELAKVRRAVAAGSGESQADLQDAVDVATLRLAHDRGGCPAVVALEAFLRERPQSKQSARARDDLTQFRSDEPGGCS